MLGKKKNLMYIIACLVLTLFVATACGKAENKAQTGGNDKKEKTSFSIGGASLGGTYYAMAGEWSKVISQKLGKEIAVEATGGTNQNIQLVHQGTLDFALATSGTADDGYKGTGWATTKNDNIRGLIPINPLYFQFWTSGKSGIKTLKNLDGKRVNLSSAGSGADIYGRAIFKILNIKPAGITNVSHSQANQMMQDGLIDASLSVGGLPQPAIDEFTRTNKGIVVGVSEKEDIDKILKELPYLSVSKIKANSYEGQTAEIETLTDFNFMIVNKDIPDSLVYDITKTTFENKDTLKKSGASWSLMDMNDTSKIPIPIHPGAKKYLEEKGVKFK